MRVFFDASVVIAALLSPSGGSSLLLQLTKKGIIIGLTSQTVIDEVLEKDKAERLKKSRGEIEAFISQSGLVVRERVSPEEIVPYQTKIDVQDAHLLAGANLTKCSHLVSLDKKHVMRTDVQKLFLPLRIVSPKELLKEIVGRNRPPK